MPDSPSTSTKDNEKATEEVIREFVREMMLFGKMMDRLRKYTELLMIANATALVTAYSMLAENMSDLTKVSGLGRFILIFSSGLMVAVVGYIATQIPEEAFDPPIKRRHISISLIVTFVAIPLSALAFLFGVWWSANIYAHV